MTDPRQHARLPLFPLSTVLFPGGTLPLRIFEARYLDMVTERLRVDGEFGVVAIREGKEVGDAALTHTLGTLAEISDWDRTPEGLLHVTARGTSKFRVLETQVLANQLQVAAIQRLEPEPLMAVPADFQVLADIAADLLSKLRPDCAQDPDVNTDDAAWVGGRLVELLPLEMDLKQELLELDDPLTRLAMLDTQLRKLHVS